MSTPETNECSKRNIEEVLRPVGGNFFLSDFELTTGEKRPELTIHYTILGEPSRGRDCSLCNKEHLAVLLADARSMTLKGSNFTLGAT